MFSQNKTKYFIVIYFLLFNINVFSQGWVLQTTPSKNQINVNNNINIVVVFDRPILQSSINSNNILVRGSVRSLYNLTFNYSSTSNTLTIIPASNFKVGEKINVTITGNLQDQSNHYMNNAVNWCFTSKVNGGTGNFTLNSSALLTENHPAQMVSGDFDNDGDVDIVLNNRSSNNIDVLKNDGIGNFTKTLLTSGYFVPSDIIAGDLDNDNDNDFVVSWENSNVITVYKNNGNATFFQSGIIVTNLRPVAVMLCNLDKDGYLDLAFANWDSDEVSVYRNDGNGRFNFLTNFYPGIRPLCFGSGDVDNDGDIDLAVGIDWNPAQVAIVLNNGSGIFSLSQYIIVRDRPYSITENNFNNNSYLDFCISNLYDNTLSLLINNDGIFTSNLLTAGGNYARKVINGDFDSDGDIDLALASSNSSNISIYKNDGNAIFTGYLLINSFGYSFCIVSNDLDGDGDLDLATTNYLTNSLSIFKNDNPVSINPSSNNIPDAFELKQNFPNPFNPTTTIKFNLAKNEFVTMKVYNSLGKKITTLVDENLAAGEYTIHFDTDKLGIESGIYYYKINAGQFVDTKKMLLIK